MYREALTLPRYKQNIERGITPTAVTKQMYQEKFPYPCYKIHVSNVIRTYISNLV